MAKQEERPRGMRGHKEIMVSIMLDTEGAQILEEAKKLWPTYDDRSIPVLIWKVFVDFVDQEKDRRSTTS